MTNEEYAIAIKEGRTEYITPLWENVEKLLRMNCKQWWSENSNRFAQCGVTFEDLFQESYLALMDAVTAYDSSNGYKLTSYLRYPLQNRFNALLGIRSHNRNNPLNNCASLNDLIGDEEDCELMDLTPDPNAEHPFQQTEQEDYIAYWHDVLEDAMRRKLDRQQKNIVYDFYYLRLQKAVIAEKYGLPLREVQVILRKSLDSLRGDHELVQRYRDDIIMDGLYKGTGLTAFRDSRLSTVERSVETLERKTAHLTR